MCHSLFWGVQLPMAEVVRRTGFRYLLRPMRNSDQKMKTRVVGLGLLVAFILAVVFVPWLTSNLTGAR